MKQMNEDKRLLSDAQNEVSRSYGNELLLLQSKLVHIGYRPSFAILDSLSRWPCETGRLSLRECT